MFLTQPNFFEEERLAPILDRNNEYLNESMVQGIIGRTSVWKHLVKDSKTTVQTFKVTDIENTPSQRIITHDAERTFLNKDKRKTLVRILSCYENHFKDYHQGLSLICGFLLLSMNEQDVADIVSVLASHQKYIPEYWRAESIAAARDAYVWQYLLQKLYPDIAAHLKKRTVLPETFCQKWFIALTINVLPFKALYLFFEHFLHQGYTYLFKFGLMLVSTCKDDILAGQDYEIFQILRNDKELVKKKEHINDDLMIDIVQRASTYELMSFDIQAVREAVFKENLEERLKAAEIEKLKAKEEAEKKGKVEDDDDSDDSEEGQSCDICDENTPDMWCLKCKKMICEKCHSKSASPHSSKHKVDEDWSKYEDPNYDND
jgi:hypothetical protein